MCAMLSSEVQLYRRRVLSSKRATASADALYEVVRLYKNSCLKSQTPGISNPDLELYSAKQLKAGVKADARYLTFRPNKTSLQAY